MYDVINNGSLGVGLPLSIIACFSVALRFANGFRIKSSMMQNPESKSISVKKLVEQDESLN